MANILSKWKTGLARTSKATFGQLATLFGATEITEDTWDELRSSPYSCRHWCRYDHEYHGKVGNTSRS